MGFYDIEPTGLALRSFYVLDKEWALLSAGSAEHCNAMTVSWGTMGTLWNLPVTTVYARPQRYTREFLDNSAHYTLSFFGGRQMEALGYLGAHSGRDGDKMAQTGLSFAVDDRFGAPFAQQAQLVMVCRKLYCDDLKADRFADPSIIEADYPEGDFHRQYVGEVVRVMLNEGPGGDAPQ